MPSKLKSGSDDSIRVAEICSGGVGQIYECERVGSLRASARAKPRGQADISVHPVYIAAQTVGEVFLNKNADHIVITLC